MKEIVKWPDARLEQRAEEVPTGERCRELIEEMYDSLGPTGIGLAAPQIGEGIRLIVIGKDALEDQAQMPFPVDADLVLINPEIHTYSWKTDRDDEGCLSVPGFGGSVDRHVEITLSALTRTGEQIKFVATKYFARVLQHEIDHLNGILFIDRAKEVWKHGSEPSL